MAGIESLLSGGLKTFGADKVSELNPQLREILPFALNPQGYIIGKAVNSLADYLGYGNEVKDLQARAKDEKDYFKETMRDAIGNVLPEALGDFVRANPRGSTDEPASTYWDPETQSWKESNAPIVVNPYQFEDTMRNETYGTMTPGQGQYVGPLSEDNPIFQVNASNLPYDIGAMPTSGAPQDFDPVLLKSIIDATNNVRSFGGDLAPRGDVTDILDSMSFNNNSRDTSQNKSSQDETNDLMTSMTAFGGGMPDLWNEGGGGKYMAYATGGQIYKGIR